MTGIDEPLANLARRLQRCAECGREWIDPRERWQAHLTADDELGFYCPKCGGRESGEEA